jgi:KDO2-lipid IV(A) lauroyltransferase
MREIRPEYQALWPRKWRWLRPLRRLLQYWLARGALALAGRLPLPALQRLGRVLGSLVYRFGKTDRAVCEHQLGQAFPERSAEERAAIARACFAHLGMTAMEMLSLPRLSLEPEPWLTLERAAVLQEASARGRGVILVTCHSGNWELLNTAVNRLKIPSLAVARPLNNPRLNALVLDARRSTYLEVMQRGSKDSPRQLLKALKQGKALILLIDQDLDAQNVYVDFFGVAARTPRVAASLALRMNVPIVTAFDRRLPDGTHVMRFGEVPVTEAIRAAADADRALTQAITAEIEAHVRAWPEQWAWNHRRWLHPPEEDPAPAAGGEGPT